jgi:predicted peptidase
MYRGSAEQDVLDVLAEARRDYKIDPNRIYLMGHSRGIRDVEHRDGTS